LRSRKSISASIDVLIDTSFLLPALGMDVDDEVLEAIKLFRQAKIYYLELGLTEAIWRAIKLVPKDKVDRVELGVRSIRESYSLLTPPPQAFTEAMKIYWLGHRDFIDAIHYAAARSSGTYFLTVDRTFIDFLNREGYPVEGIVLTPAEFAKLITGRKRFS